jgi:hypothetical protein
LIFVCCHFRIDSEKRKNLPDNSGPISQTTTFTIHTTGPSDFTDHDITWQTSSINMIQDHYIQGIAARGDWTEAPGRDRDARVPESYVSLTPLERMKAAAAAAAAAKAGPTPRFADDAMPFSHLQQQVQ